MKIFNFIVIILILTGSLNSCQKNDNTNMANIDNLYAQPLSVIQKYVQGKWKWYLSCGGIAGCDYSDNTIVDFEADHYIIDYKDGSQLTFPLI